MGAVATGNFSFIVGIKRGYKHRKNGDTRDLSGRRDRLGYLQDNTLQIALEEELCVTLHCHLGWSSDGRYP